MRQHDDDLICVGHILGAQGIKGWVRVYSNTSPRENILNYGPWLLERGERLEPVRVQGRLQGKNVLARLDGVDDRTRAESLVGCKLYIERQQLPRPESGDYYWSEIIGLKVETLTAEPLGLVAEMLETGADDVMVVTGERERLIPFAVDSIVREVDLEGRRLVVDWSPDY